MATDAQIRLIYQTLWWGRAGQAEIIRPSKLFTHRIMSKASNVAYLKPEQRAIVDACIRRHLYVNTAAMVAELAGRDIKLSKSGLNRYASKLRAGEALHAGTSNATIVIIVERGTGSVTSLTTSASQDVVAALVAGFADK